MANYFGNWSAISRKRTPAVIIKSAIMVQNFAVDLNVGPTLNEATIICYGNTCTIKLAIKVSPNKGHLSLS